MQKFTRDPAQEGSSVGFPRSAHVKFQLYAWTFKSDLSSHIHQRTKHYLFHDPTYVVQQRTKYVPVTVRMRRTAKHYLFHGPT